MVQLSILHLAIIMRTLPDPQGSLWHMAVSNVNKLIRFDYISQIIFISRYIWQIAKSNSNFVVIWEVSRKNKVTCLFKLHFDSCSQEMRGRYYDSRKCTKSLGINGNHARLESDNKTSRTKGTHDSRVPDNKWLLLVWYARPSDSHFVLSEWSNMHLIHSVFL